MDNLFKEFPHVDVIYTVGEDYYLSEPKHLGEGVEVNVYFRDEQAKLVFEASKGVFSETESAERITALSLELEDAKAEAEALRSELESLKAQAKPKAEK
jgi:uncharacterized small protein (DUF1192 family)